MILGDYNMIQDVFLFGEGSVGGLGHPKKKELFIQCDCQGEVLKIDKWADEEKYYISVFKYDFTSISFLRRIGYARDVLWGKSIRTADLVISKENFNKIKKFK